MEGRYFMASLNAGQGPNRTVSRHIREKSAPFVHQACILGRPFAGLLCQNARMPKRSRRGARGRTGARGKAGPAGPVGPKVKRAEILAVVDDEFVEVRKNFKVQLTHSTKIQTQLEE